MKEEMVICLGWRFAEAPEGVGAFVLGNTWTLSFLVLGSRPMRGCKSKAGMLDGLLVVGQGTG